MVATGVLLFLVAAPLGLWDPGSLYDRFGELLITLSIFALGFCLFLWGKGQVAPSSTDSGARGNFIWDFYWGTELHPMLFGVQLKQWINCRVAMMGWAVIVVAFAAKQRQLYGDISDTMMLCVALQLVYIAKFFWWEGGYFHSIDIMHDRFGFYICWGVCAWLPCVYTIAAFYLVEHPMDLPVWQQLAIVAFGLLSIWANYSADEQRQRVRAADGKTKIWGRKPDIIRAKYTAGDGQERESILLVSGFWGITRHFHYLPEIGLAAAWTLPAGFRHFLPWFYVFFLTILLLDRARRDDHRCAKKYGVHWTEYQRRVPYRVIPGIY
jgi:7-dehydrocholesterol reductase